jgi:SAM-dependent methyltransferase
MREPDPPLLRDVERYYTARVEEHGATARGVDWNSRESQELRFRQLARLWEDAGDTDISVIDYGCGYGALVDFLTARDTTFRYQGFDISSAMIREAQSRAGSDRRFTSDASSLVRADYVVASGIFNVKLAASTDAWEDYMRQTVAAMAGLAERGFAFNALTSYADADKRRQDLHYADPSLWFDHCKRIHSRFVTLLHDYPLYEFTLLVRLTASP